MQRHFWALSLIGQAACQDLFLSAEKPQPIMPRSQSLRGAQNSSGQVSGPVPDATVYSLRLRGNHNLCFDLAGGKQDNGTPIQVWQCNGLENQLWYFPAGAWKIMLAVNNNKCIDAGSMRDGTFLFLWDCNGQASQAFGYDSNQGTLYLSQSEDKDKPDASKCADLSGGSQNPGTHVQVWDCNGHTNQAWDPVPGGGPSPTPSGSDVSALLGLGCNNCHGCGVEGCDSTRAKMDGQIGSACKNNGCTLQEAAVIWAMVMQESDKMDKSDTSKGSSGGSSNWSPWNMNMDELGYLGCDYNCAKSLGQYDGKYNLDRAVYYLLKGLRGQSSIGGACDLMNFHRDGSTGWKACKGQGCNCDCGSKGCKAYKDATADAANQILKDQSIFTNGKRVCEKVPHIR